MARPRPLFAILGAALPAAFAGCTERIPLPERPLPVDAAEAADLATSGPEDGPPDAVDLGPGVRDGAVDGRRPHGSGVDAWACFRGGDTFLRQRKPTVVFSIDRSPSMYAAPKTGQNGRTRSEAVRQAVAKLLKGRSLSLVALYQDFPSVRNECASRSCCASEPVYGASGTDGESRQRCEAAVPACNDSPAHEALDSSRETLRGIRRRDISPGPSFVVLVTDGEPRCGGVSTCTEAQLIVEGLRGDEMNGVVIAVGDEAKNASCLVGLATETSFFFEAADEGALEEAAERLGAVFDDHSCSFTLKLEGPFGSNVPAGTPLNVVLKGVPLPRDVESDVGWYTLPADGLLKLHGAACETIKELSSPQQLLKVTHCL